MGYDPRTGKRIKKPFNQITWVHRALRLADFSLQQCLFGEHQLRHAPFDQPVALVESEKTAIIAQGYCPRLLWLATGSLQGLTPARCQALKQRSLILFPDLGAYSAWRNQSQVLSRTLGSTVTVSDFLATHASPADQAAGFDLADYLVQYDPQVFGQVRF